MINRNGHANLRHQIPIQRDIFERSDEIVVDPGPALKAAMRQAEKQYMSHYSMSRENIIDDMNEMAEQANITCNGNAKKTSLAIYSKWLSNDLKYNIPIRMLHIFCRAVKSTEPLEVYARFFRRVAVVFEEDLKKLEWAELEIAKRNLTKRSKKLASEVGL